MGIGTEAFSAEYAAELSALRDSARAAGVVEGRYVNDALGIAFELPSGWIARDLREIARTAEGRLLTSHAEELNDAFRSLTEQFLPLVAISAPVWDDPVARLGPHELSPVAALYLEEGLSAAASGDFDLWEHVAVDLAHFHAHIEDYRLLEAPERTSLSGCPAVSYWAAYTFLHADAVEGCPTREWSHYVLHESQVLALRLCDYPDRHARLAHDFRPFVATLRFR